MTTLVLQAAGQALGSAVAGPFGAALGQAAGGLAGAMLDGQLFRQPTRAVSGPRLTEMDGLASTEGAPIPRVYGRAKVGGQLIWATRFEEEAVTTTRVTRGGKSSGGGQRTRETSFNYYANIAIALCEGPLTFARRVWADGREIDLTRIAMRFHNGWELQGPDPLIVAKEGAVNAPAYRSLAYVVFERLPLAEFGNRIPQFTFEVVRALPGVRDMIRSVNLIPGSSEFAYQATAVTRGNGLGSSAPENRLQLQAGSDLVASLDQLQLLCPNLTNINLVVSWFGDDLRVGSCTVAPRVDNAVKQTEGGTWRVAELERGGARLVSLVNGRPSYGGTPSDASVLSAIAEIRRRGLKVTLYPFIMMDVPPGSTLPDPRFDGFQPPFPWRGRMTCDPAPGRPGSPDGTAAAAAQVAAFVGTVTPADLVASGGEVVALDKGGEWSFRRLVLHYARIAEMAGGVEGFIIGTEMVGLTRVRSASGVYPFVEALVGVAADVRAILGPWARVTYAADWTEYGSHVLGGGQEVRFPLDPLWASPDISAVAIDYYAPITDWREGVGHADEAAARSPYDLAHLVARQRAGEAFDWFYASDLDRAAQNRLPITDGLAGKPWIYRPKDLAAWWLNPHVERVDGQELPNATAWIAGSKPLMLTEIGCPAVDKGANSPNIFPDTLSVEGGSPPFSTRQRDDLAQLRFIEAQISAFDPASPRFLPAANPINPVTGLRMLDPADISVWAWDARPFPAFPMLTGVWSDGRNWHLGHWLNGRLEGAALDRLAAAILADYGLPPAELALDAMVDGYVIDRPMSARAALEPLARLFGFDVSFRAGALALRERDRRAPIAIDAAELEPGKDGDTYQLSRAQESELPREVRVGFIDGDFDYRRAVERSRRLAGGAHREITLEAGAVFGRETADRLAEARLKDAWTERETLTFRISPRRRELECGDHILFPIDGVGRLFRITAIEDGASRAVTAVSTERGTSAGRALPQAFRPAAPPLTGGRPFAALLELPLAAGEGAALHHMAVNAQPWRGAPAILRGGDGVNFAPFAAATRPALVGRTLNPLKAGPLWRWDRVNAVDIEIDSGGLQAVPEAEALAGVNSFALYGPDGLWEIISSAHVTLIGQRRYRLARLIRGLGGSEPQAARLLAPGALIVALDAALVPLGSSLNDLGRPIAWRVVPAGADAGDPAAVTLNATLTGAALKPFAPVHVRARRRAGGVRLSWIRRARFDADGWEIADPPLGEAAERYRLKLMQGTSVAFSVETTAPHHLLTPAEELAAFGAAQAVLNVNIAQLSATVGEGTSLIRTVTVN
jgi:hypothetical protein